MIQTVKYKGYSMEIKGPHSSDGSYGGTFSYPGSSCVIGGSTLDEAISDFKHFVDEHLQSIKQEKQKVEAVNRNRLLFKTTVEYMGILGTVEIDEKSKGFMGNILKTGCAYTYKGKDYESFINDFHSKVDKYIKDSKNNNQEKQYKGSFNVRVKPSVHKDAIAYAMDNNISLNKLVESAIEEKIYNYGK